jgi:TetR/AcrR family transcriptional regulator, cholesterol catabolism regulator
MVVHEEAHRRSKRSQATRSTIIAAGAAVFARTRYEMASLDDIAAEAGVTKGTIYYHFDSKESLYTAVLTSYLTDATERLQAIADSGLPARPMIERVIRHLVEDTLDRSKSYSRYQFIVDAGPTLQGSVREAQRAYEQTLAAIIERGQAAGEIMSGNPKVLAFLLIGSIGRTARWYDPGGELSPAAFVDTVMRLLLHGLLAGHGSAPAAPVEHPAGPNGPVAT